MTVTAVIPFRPKNPKTRLSCVLEPEERDLFAGMMLSEVVDAVVSGGCQPLILATEPFSFGDVPVLISTSGLNDALNAFLAQQDGPILIIMADIPLATGESVKRMVSTSEDMSMVPGRGGGTNAIFLSRGSLFRVDYYQASFLKHVAIAKERGLSCEIVDSFRIHTDIDEKEDLVELLIHGRGKSRRYLEELGFHLSIEKGRVGVEREKEEQ